MARRAKEDSNRSRRGRPPAEVHVSRNRELSRLKKLLSSDDVRAVQVVGSPGQGKTTLIKMLERASDQPFADRVFYMGIRDITSIGPFIDAQWQDLFAKVERSHGPVLVVWDDFDNSPALRASHVLDRLWRVNPQTKVVFTSRHPLPADEVPAKVEVEGLNFDEFSALCRLIIDAPTSDLVETLYNEVQGSPLAIKLIAHASMGDATAVVRFLQALVPFGRPGLVGPDGTPLGRHSRGYGTIVSHVRQVNDEALRVLAARPEGLYELTARQFEELVAELLQRQGYDVTLTPRTRDGGKDVYAAMQSPIGRFLFVVECKRYAPDRPVGVGIVRNLYGQVQKERATAGILATTSFFTKDAKEFRQDIEYQLSFQDYYGLKKWLDEVVQL
jgi:restriction system protein